MLKPFFAHAPQAFVWHLHLYGGNLASYLPIPLEKISQTWVGAFLKKRQQFIFLISTICRRAKEEEEEGEMGVFSTT